ncbi:hypothetical protein DICPUDRAFT_157536 [Dictyostelium purpureum]|uniref:HMA domain-containing protein n=1 Tax=Dictyostelium purpureum TaxID=5786 RepID=F0ZZD2_DICPU|nr:uncharacterized protein DICPUDRAFT_157536 [Dictyostelium purpureum]EGC30713.1 hypothetical protein DICPUDRAFT_157536 [Dictyostelium purpureum]|eukprot:XP_003292776.1 hypothetical protein DICPUDRAFT_157536 [Dictyostelium purpureum]
MAISIDKCNCQCSKCTCNELLNNLTNGNFSEKEKAPQLKPATCCSPSSVSSSSSSLLGNGANPLSPCQCSKGSCYQVLRLIDHKFFRFFVPQLNDESQIPFVENSISQLDNVLSVKADHLSNTVQVECNADGYLFKLLNCFKQLNLNILAIQTKECPQTTNDEIINDDTPLLNQIQSPVFSNETNEFKERSFEIDGMLCELGCANIIEATLLSNKNVKSLEIDFNNRVLKISGDLTDRQIRKTIERLGFKCKRIKQVKQTSLKEEILAVKQLPPISSNSDPTIIEMEDNASGINSSVANDDYKALQSSSSSASNKNEIEMMDIKCENPPSSVEKVSIGVYGMTCASCVGMVEHSIKSVSGVLECNVNLLAERAEITFHPEVAQVKDIQESIEILGFETKLIQESKPGLFFVKIKESSQLSQVQIENILNDLSIMNGIFEVSKEQEGEESTASKTKKQSTSSKDLIIKIEGDSLLIGPRIVIKFIKTKYNIESELHNPDSSDAKDSLLRKREIAKWRRIFLIDIAFTGPLIIIAMILVPIKSITFLHKEITGGFPVEALIGFILATPVQIIGGYPFYRAAWAALRNLHGNMDLLVAVGSTAAYVYSIISIILGIVNPEYEGMHFFETSASLITFITLGRWLENIAKGHTSSAIVKLMNLQAKESTLITFVPGTNQIESEEVIPSNLIQYGDHLKVVPGASIPTDGVVVYGNSSVDESMLTGESIPVSKKEGDAVTGGTLNLEGVVYICANKVGSESTLSQIIGLVQQAQTSKAPIQALADKISKFFVPIIILLGIITFAIWFAITQTNVVSESWRHNTSPFLISFLTAISVVVIACPCALGLATPTAVMVGTGVGASMGILIKGGKPLETAHKATAVLFDKTGTITTGKMTVTDYRINTSEVQLLLDDQVPVSNQSDHADKFFFKIVGASESGSEHPIGRAIVTYCRNTLSTKGAETNTGVENYQFPPIEQFKAIPGRGLSCILDNKNVNVGNLSFMKENEIKVDPDFIQSAEQWETNGKTVIYVSFDSKFIGIMSISDIPRDDSKYAIKKLTSMGLKCYMVTGDNRRAAKYIANQVGIPEGQIFSEVIPKEKSDKVKELQDSGNVVCFVGDGVNDSPALSQADVGISVATGTDIAIESSSIVLLKNSLTDVYRSIHLSRVVFRRIRINFTLALIYNLCAVPLAAGLFRVMFGVALPPMAAAAAMVVSSLSVLSSSLLLKLYRSPK